MKYKIDRNSRYEFLKVTMGVRIIGWIESGMNVQEFRIG